MARYIDAELALELNEGELWIWDVPDLKNFLAEIPTADVVPKSEIERLNAVMKDMDEQRAYTINMLGESLEKAKTEVAREIFEEIDKKVRCVEYGSFYFLEEPYQKLKKKYTEGEWYGRIYQES